MSLELFGVCCEVKAGRPGKAVSMVGWRGASLDLSEQLCPQQGLGSLLEGGAVWASGSGKNRGEVGREEQVEGAAGAEAGQREGAGAVLPCPRCPG